MLISAHQLLLLLAACTVFVVAASRPTEQERVKLWYDRGNVWPPQWQNETEGYLRLMAEREEELMAIPGSDERWENWMQYTQSRLVPRVSEEEEER